MCFGDACRMNGWEHTAAVRAAARVRELPQGWTRSLGVTVEPAGPRPVRLLRKFVSFVRTTARYINAITDIEERPVVLFLEWFDLVHIAAFALALLGVPARKLSNTAAWMNFRFAFSNNAYLRRMKWLLSLIERRLAGGLVIFTENDLVAESHARMLGRKAHVLPMPQMVTPDEPWQLPGYASQPERARQLVCFWPGQAAPEKGLAIISSLTKSTSPAARGVTIVADESARFTAVEGGCAIILLKKGMSRADYIGWLRTMDLALVPYMPEAYANRTSGIFGDAIAVGKPPVVTEGTWMAHELRRFDLGELVVDWDAPDVIETLTRLAHDPRVANKLAVLTAAYADFHSRRGYARVIKQVFDTTHRAARGTP